MGAFSLDTRDGVATITFDLPGEPVNKFSAAVKGYSSCSRTSVTIPRSALSPSFPASRTPSSPAGQGWWGTLRIIAPPAGARQTRTTERDQ